MGEDEICYRHMHGAGETRYHSEFVWSSNTIVNTPQRWNQVQSS